MIIKDDGLGMKPDDFQNKFLKIDIQKEKVENLLHQIRTAHLSVAKELGNWHFIMR